MKYWHSEDFTSVTWNGEHYDFNKTQAACVSFLWSGWKKERAAQRADDP